MSASLETTFLKLPHQSQTPDAAEVLADQIEQLGLGKDDIIYLDLLSNLAYMGRDAEGYSTEPTKGGKVWHIPGSLVAAARPRLRKQLDKLSAIRPACREATVMCGLPTPATCNDAAVEIRSTSTTSWRGKWQTCTWLCQPTARPVCWPPCPAARSSTP